jgi:hypothetical protein
MVTGQIVAGQIVADKWLRTIRRMDKSLQDKMSRTLRRGQNVVDNSSHGQNVAWTNRPKDK